MLNVSGIYTILLLVDVICGPVLTMVFASPAKPHRELLMDLSLVGLVQLCALGYGLSTLESARPIAYVFEVDRLVVVQKNELHTIDCNNQCKSINSFGTIQWKKIDFDQLKKDRSRSLDLSLQGISPAMRQNLWIDWDWRDSKLQAALQPLSTLSNEKQNSILQSHNQYYLKSNELKYLPIVSSKTLDWIAVFDSQGKWVGAFPVDGFKRQ